MAFLMLALPVSGIANDISKALTDGKTLILEGLHCHPGILAKYVTQLIQSDPTPQQPRATLVLVRLYSSRDELQVYDVRREDVDLIDNIVEKAHEGATVCSHAWNAGARSADAPPSSATASKPVPPHFLMF